MQASRLSGDRRRSRASGSYRASDRHADGEAAPAARHDVQQRAGTRRIRFEAAFGAHLARARALHRPRHSRLLPPVYPQQLGPAASCRLAGARERDSAAPAARSNAFLARGDMVRIFVRRPSGNFVEARYADLTLPSVTLHEAVAARRALLAKGRQEINTRAIVGTAIAQRKLVEAQRQAEETRRALAALNKTLTETGLLRDEFMAVLRHDLQRNCSWCTGG